MKNYYVTITLLFISNLANCQWQYCNYTKNLDFYPPTNYVSNKHNDVFLEITNFKQENKTSMYINLNQRKEFFNKRGLVEIQLLNSTDTILYSWEKVIDIDISITDDLVNSDFGRDLFISEKLILKINTENDSLISIFLMTGINEIKKQISEYTYFGKIKWFWNQDGYIYKLESTLFNYSKKKINKIEAQVIIYNDQEIIYRKTHILNVNFIENEIAPVLIDLNVPIDVGDISKFQETYSIIIFDNRNKLNLKQQ